MAIAALHETVLLAQKLYREGDAPGAEAASCTAASIGSPNVQRCRASRSRRQASVPRMLRSARSKELIPSDVVAPPSAPASSRALTVSAFHNAARCKGVNPSLSRASNLAPPATKALTVSASPELAATCNGVSPRVSVRASTLAPAPIRALTFATRSSIAARRRALRPNLGGATGRASETMRSSTIRTNSLSITAWCSGVSPFLPRAPTAAPAAISASTASALPNLAARCNGVPSS